VDFTKKNDSKLVFLHLSRTNLCFGMAHALTLVAFRHKKAFPRKEIPRERFFVLRFKHEPRLCEAHRAFVAYPMVKIAVAVIAARAQAMDSPPTKPEASATE